MAECTIPTVPAYAGAETCVGDADVQRLSFCQAFSYLKDTLVPYINNTFVVKLEECKNWIAEQVATIATDTAIVISAKATVEATMGATYAGVWNNTDDYTNKTTTHNGIVWVGLTPTVGVAPNFNKHWLFVAYATKKIYKNSDYSANYSEEIFVDTTANKVTITLPTASLNMRVRIVDQEMYFFKNNCNVVASDETIINKISDGTPYQIDIRGASRTLECVKNKNDILEWRVV